MDDEITVAELMNRMPRAFLPEAAAGVDAVIQFSLTGEEGGDWVATIRDQQCTVEKRHDPESDHDITGRRPGL